MAALLLKDLRLQKKFIALGFVFVGFVFFALGAFDGLPVAVPAAIFSHFLLVVASKSDERNNNGRMLASFPLLRREIVSAKYIGIFMFLAIAFLLTSLLHMLFGLILPADELLRYDLRSTIVTISLQMIFYSFYFPFFFGWGSRYAQFLDLLVLFTLAGIAVLALRILEWMKAPVSAAVPYLLTMDNTLMLFGGTMVILTMLTLSWVISVRIYERRSL